MWLEITLGLTVGTLACIGILSPVVYPKEVGRVARLVRAEVGSWFGSGRRLRRVSIQAAVDLGVDVDMAWWDKQFSKAQAALPSRGIEHSWGTQIESMVSSLSRFNDIQSITMNDLTISRPDPREASVLALANDFKRWEPGMPEWQRLKLARDIRNAHTTGDIGVAWAAANAALAAAKRIRESDQEPHCDECEYVDVSTYADTVVRLAPTIRCPKHAANEADRQRSMERVKSGLNAYQAGVLSHVEMSKIINEETWI